MTEEKKMEVKHDAEPGFVPYYYVVLAGAVGYLVYTVFFSH